MAQWRVTRGDEQLGVGSVDALIARAQRGELVAGDLIQPPGASDWIYANEVPALVEHLPDDADDADDDLTTYRRGGVAAPVLAGGFGVALLVGLVAVAVLIPRLPAGQRLLGDGGLSMTQVIVTDDGVALLDAPGGGRELRAVARDTALELKGKRDGHYLLKAPDGTEGWVSARRVLPAYKLAGPEAHERYDPLYNPDRYVNVLNAGWTQPPLMPGQAPPEDGTPTVFTFMFGNHSDYDMTDLVVLATIRDARKQKVGEAELAIGGVLPAGGQTMVGTLAPPADDKDAGPVYLTEHTFQQRAKKDPSLVERWTDGLTVTLEGEGFDSASVDVVQLRAIVDAG